TFVRVSGRIGNLARANDSQIDEFMGRYRSDRIGDVQFGRFHWFPGPFSNDLLGRLLSFTTADGILWRLPTGQTTQVHLAWFDKINPLRGPRPGGSSARVSVPALKGRVGVTLLTASGPGRDLGFGGDAVIPLWPQQLEVYGEVGRDPLRENYHA